jgi:hypothetical protein
MPLYRETLTARIAAITGSGRPNYKRPMWPAPSFGSPFFVRYGKNGGNVKQDGANRYVYAVSNNGFWNDGDQYLIGRVARTKLAGLRADDWEYFQNGDGSDSSRWSSK